MMTLQYFIDHEAFSISSLKLIRTNPLGFYKRKILKEKEITEPTTAQKLGTLIDEALLTPRAFDDRYAFIPDHVIEPTTQKHKDWCQEYLKIQEHPERHNLQGEEAHLPWHWDTAYRLTYTTRGKSETQISKDSLDLYTKYMAYLSWAWDNGKKETLSQEYNTIIGGILERLSNNPAAQALLQNATDFEDEIVPTECFFTQLPLIGNYISGDVVIPIKGLIDSLLIDHKNKVIKINDLKSTSMSFYSIPGIIKRFSYHEQLAFYTVLVLQNISELCPGYDPNPLRWYKIEMNLIFVRTKPSYEVLLVELDGEIKIDAEKSFKQLLYDYTWHLDNGNWELPRVMTGGKLVLNSWDQKWDSPNNLESTGIDMLEDTSESVALSILDSEFEMSE